MKSNHKEAAKHLFLQGWELVRISRVLDTSERTISRWKDAGRWEQKKTEYSLSRQTAEESVWDLINYQLKILELKTDAWEKEEKPILIDKGDIDALTKLFAMVKAKEHTWTQHVHVMREFVEWYQARDLPSAKELLDPIDEFLNETRKEL